MHFLLLYICGNLWLCCRIRQILLGVLLSYNVLYFVYLYMYRICSQVFWSLKNKEFFPLIWFCWVSIYFICRRVYRFLPKFIMFVSLIVLCWASFGYGASVNFDLMQYLDNVSCLQLFSFMPVAHCFDINSLIQSAFLCPNLVVQISM